MNDVPKYPNHIKDEIKRRGYKLNEVAKALYISERTLWNYCAGRRAVPRDILAALAKLLECPISALGDEMPLSDRATQQSAPSPVSPVPPQSPPDLSIPLAVEHVVLHYASGQRSIFVAPEHHTSMHPLAIEAYEDVLTLAWEAFYTSCAQRSASAVHHWLLYLTHMIPVASGPLQDHLMALCCRFLQLSSVLARDRSEFRKALDDINEAIMLAVALQNTELMASSLYRRAKVYAKQQQYSQAAQDLENALPFASRSRDPLRCYISMFLAEVYSLLDAANTKLFEKSLTLLDDVDRAVRAWGVLEGDGSFVKVDVSGLYMIRGDVLRRAGQLKEAQQALLIVQQSLPKEFIRWRGNLYHSEAQLALADKDIESGCQLALQALDFVDATHSRSNTVEIERLYWEIRQMEPSHPRLKELGSRLGIA